jgi:glycosyltransferase involved in cell wall biosynthesis
LNVVHLVIGGEVAGGQLVALRLAHAARARGHNVSLVSPSDGPFVELARADRFRVSVVPITGALDAPGLLHLVRVLRKGRTELVHTHGHFGVNVAGRVAGRLAGARVLSHMHIENVFRAGAGRAAQIALDNATARLCFAIVAVSEATRQSLERQGYPRQRLVTIHNGIEPAGPAQPVTLADGPTVLEVARLAEVKGQRLLLRALQHLDATAVLVGRDLEASGAYEQELRADAERLGVAERVIFAGQRDDVPGLMAGCAVVCLPSSLEGLPLVILEAMAQARPVVATAVGGTPELVVDGVTGLLVPPGDADALAQALGTVLGNAELARQLGEAGRERVVAEFSADATAGRVLGLYTA